MQLSLKALKERRDRGLTEVEGRRPSGIPVEVVLVASGPVERPVSLAQALTGFGLPLDAAHAVLNHLVSGESVPVTLHLTPGGEMPFALSQFGVAIGQPVEPASPLRKFLAREVADAVEAWRLDDPAHPSTGEVLGHIVREYLVEHGRLDRTAGAQHRREVFEG